MQSITLNILNQEANQIIKDLVEKGFVSVENNINTYLPELSDAFKLELDKEYTDFVNEEGETYSLNEVFSKYKK